MTKRRFTDEALIECLKQVDSINSLLPLLGLTKHAGNHRTVKRRIAFLGLDTSHLLGKKAFLKRGNARQPRPLNEILKENIHINSYHLKRRLFKEGLLINRCSECGLTEWREKPLALQMDHINGIPTDNRIENLRILCPNCHTQTQTYSGKNANTVKNESEIVESYKSLGCKKTAETYKVSTSTVRAYRRKAGAAIYSKPAKEKKPKTGRLNPYPKFSNILKKRKVVRPSLDTLKEDIKKLGFLQTGKKYGVSDTAIRKWLKAYLKIDSHVKISKKEFLYILNELFK